MYLTRRAIFSINLSTPETVHRTFSICSATGRPNLLDDSKLISMFDRGRSPIWATSYLTMILANVRTSVVFVKTQI